MTLIHPPNQHTDE